MSLLKVNEVQNYNGSSLTLTASTVSTSAQLNTGGNISVTGSLNVSDDSTTRSNLGLGSIATQDSDNVTVTGGTATLGALTVSGSDSGDLVRITQTGSGNALVVEDSANPDSSPFVVDASGNVGIGTASPSSFNQRVTAPQLVVGSGSNSSGVTVYSGTANQGSINFADGTTTTQQYEGGLVYNHPSNYMSFHTNGGTERMRIDSSGNVSITQDPGKYTIDTTGGTSTISNNGTVDFLSASGMLLVNNHNNGHIGLFLCGGGSTTLVSSVGSGVGTLTFTSSIYRFTNNTGATANFGFFFVRTRTTA